MPKPRTPARKYHFMLGTTSRVPDRPGWHYLLFDFDSKCVIPARIAELCDHEMRWQETQSGWHIFTSLKMRLEPMLTVAVSLGADRTWARLALKRGWAFLADKGEVKIPWPVERCVIGWRNAQKTIDSNTRSLMEKNKKNTSTGKNIKMRGLRKTSKRLRPL